MWGIVLCNINLLTVLFVHLTYLSLRLEARASFGGLEYVGGYLFEKHAAYNIRFPHTGGFNVGPNPETVSSGVLSWLFTLVIFVAEKFKLRTETEVLHKASEEGVCENFVLTDYRVLRKNRTPH